MQFLFDKRRRITISAYTKQVLTIAAVIIVVLIAFPFIKLHYGNQLSFSREPGFYDSPFYLSIYGGRKYAIHYTLDGSEPTTNDPVFNKNKPLYIEDATTHPNVYSMRTDTSTGFLTDLIEKYTDTKDIPNYTAPDYPVDKCTVIRASLFDSAGNCLSSITGTYFIGFQEKTGYQNIYTASIVTSPENLFDDDIGIYVNGSTFDHFLNNEDNFSELPHWPNWVSNYFMRGIGWEREAYITLFDNQQNTVLSQKCGIRIKGEGSCALLPRSIRCYARTEYSEHSAFQADIFHENSFPDKIVLFSGGQDNIFRAKDYLVHALTQDLPFATIDFIPCVLFLDGEYWGTYYITEDYDAEYIHHHYQVAKDNIIMMKRNSYQDNLTAGIEDDRQLYEEMTAFINEHNMTDSENYNRACDLIDIDSYIDYYAMEIYIANVDWPHNNIALWRTRTNDGSIYGDTKWRWMLFDINQPGKFGDYLFLDSLTYVIGEDPVFASLYQNETFRRQFAQRLLYIGKEVFAPETCNLFIDQYVQTMREPLAASNMRFYMDDKSDEFEQYAADMRTFFEQRYDVVWDFLVQDMGEEWLAQNGIQK